MSKADTLIPSRYRAQALNRYAYVENNPLSLTDPTGMSPEILVTAPRFTGHSGADAWYLEWWYRSEGGIYSQGSGGTAPTPTPTSPHTIAIGSASFKPSQSGLPQMANFLRCLPGEVCVEGKRGQGRSPARGLPQWSRAAGDDPPPEMTKEECEAAGNALGPYCVAGPAGVAVCSLEIVIAGLCVAGGVIIGTIVANENAEESAKEEQDKTVGKDPKYDKRKKKILTDGDGGRAEAEEEFERLRAGRPTTTETTKGGGERETTTDGQVQIRRNPDGSTRIDLERPDGWTEVIHYD